jgi:hypothetical protein
VCFLITSGPDRRQAHQQPQEREAYGPGHGPAYESSWRVCVDFCFSRPPSRVPYRTPSPSALMLVRTPCICSFGAGAGRCRPCVSHLLLSPPLPPRTKCGGPVWPHCPSCVCRPHASRRLWCPSCVAVVKTAACSLALSLICWAREPRGSATRQRVPTGAHSVYLPTFICCLWMNTPPPILFSGVAQSCPASISWLALNQPSCSSFPLPPPPPPPPLRTVRVTVSHLLPRAQLPAHDPPLVSPIP